MTHEFLETLKTDHEEVKGMLEKLSEGPKTAKARESLFTKLKKELIPHMKGEEKHFYSVLAEKKQARMQSMEALEEHHVAEVVLKELDKLPKGAENWGAKLKVFKELLEHHIEEEEGEVFETAEEELDEDMLDQIMESFQKEKEKIKNKL
jgi:hemerythrin-like domain-containing protein